MNKTLTNRAYIRVQNTKDIKFLNSILQESFPEAIISWNEDVAQLVVSDYESFHLNLIKIFSMEMVEFGIQASFLIVPFFDYLFIKYLYKMGNSVNTAFELFLNNLNAEFVKKDLKSIIEKIEKKDLDTIKAFLRCNCNSSIAAKELYLHRNSFNYRMNHFIESTKMDIRDVNTINFLNLLLSTNN